MGVDDGGKRGKNSGGLVTFHSCPFPSWKGVFSQNGPQRSRARRCCAAKRTLHGEDRSEILDKRSEEHTSELQSRLHLVCRLLLEKKKKNEYIHFCC